MNLDYNKDVTTWSLNKKMNFLTLSDGFKRWMGYLTEETIHSPELLQEMVYSDDLHLFDEHMKKLRSGQNSSLEHRIHIEESNELKWIQSIGIPVLGQDNEVCRIDGIVMDITEKRVAKEQLESTFSLYQEMLDRINIAIWSYDITLGKVSFISDAIAKITGYPIEKAKGITFWSDIAHPDEKPIIDQILATARQGIPNLSEYRIIHANGEIRWIQVRIIPILDRSQSVVRLDGIVADITERKVMEEAIHSYEQRYKSLFDYNSDVVCELDLLGNILAINPVAEDITGERLNISRETLSIVDMFGDENAGLMSDYFEKAIKGDSQQYAVTSYRKDGGVIHWDIKNMPIQVNNRLVGIFVIAKDVTVKREVEKRLAEREAEYRLITDNMKDLMVVLDSQGNFLVASPSCENIMGIPIEFIKGTTILEHIHPDDREYLIDQVMDMLITKSRKLLRFRFIHVKGYIIYLESMGTLVFDDAGEVEKIVFVSRDITKKVGIKKELRESEERYRRLIELSPQPMVLLRQSKVVYMNLAGLNMLGLTNADEITGQSMYDYIHSDDWEVGNHRMLQLIGKNYIGSKKYKIIRVDGQVIETEVIGIYDEITETILIVIKDVTERLKMQRALQASEERYRRLVELSPVAIAVYKEGEINYINPEGAKMLGVDINNETLSTNIMDWIHPDYREYVREGMESTLLNGYSRPAEYQVVRSDGRVIIVSMLSIYDSQSSSIQLMFEEITEKKRVEQALLESDERYFRLQTSLDQFSHDLFGVMKISQMEQRLLKEVRDILKVTNVSIIEVEYNKDKLCEIIETEKGYSLKIHEKKGKSYLLCIDEKPIGLEITAIRVWLATITRYVSVLFDNFLIIEDLTKELEQNASEQVAPTWLLRFMFNLSENERKRLAQDLHDSALQEQIIWYRKLDLLLMDKSITGVLREQLGQITEGLLDVIYQLRIMCNELRPPMLIRDGLVSSLEALFDFTQLRSNYGIYFDAEHFNHKLHDDVLIGLYRIVQELLANASKHSSATEVRILLSSQEEHIRLEYEDNGIGMDLIGMRDSITSMGIHGMRERVRSMDGVIHFLSSENNGLTMSISIPAHE
ncbi:PAS domain S-box protein [Paenibacillus glacialis]|uniref:histidine kinase n=1 Tax=Paenibacillus glacialis TaxID=494026 RepID=A0A168J445_9BACL|nr:PAS domain S-box protein [Paenibacillus glacialis]OAB40135.1 hypothetical protein PGLA_18425 [Paenibacillus glacialis]